MITAENLQILIDKQGSPIFSKIGYIHTNHDDVIVLDIEMKSKNHEANGGSTKLCSKQILEKSVPVIRVYETDYSINLNNLPEESTILIFNKLPGWSAYVCHAAKYTIMVTLLRDP